MKHHKTNGNNAAAAFTHHKPTSNLTVPTSEVEGRKPQIPSGQKARVRRRAVPRPNKRSTTRLRSKASARQSRASTKERIDGSSARHGKIARLPREIREGLNWHLDQGLAGPRLLHWLNSLPETKRVLDEHFNGQPISQQNLSQWRLGGYRDWLLQQEAREAMEDFAADSQGLEGKMGFEFADKLALWLCMRYAVMTRHLERMDPLENWKPIRQMCRDVVALRRGDFKLREQRLKEEQQKKLTEEDYLKWVSAPGRLEQLYYEKTHDEKVGKKIQKQKQDRLDQIFGLTPKPDPDDENEAESAQPEAAQEGGAKIPVESSTPQAPSASGKTESHKLEQSKTKCDLPPSAETPNTKNPPSPESFRLRSEASARQAGAASQNPTNTGTNPPSSESVAPVAQVGTVGPSDLAIENS
jgi:hypothetical protein